MQKFFDNPWFATLAPELGRALLDAARPLRLAQGEILYLQGAPTANVHTGIWGVASGCLRLSVMHENGNEAILTMVEAGNWFGETALLEDLPRAATATAQEDSELLAVSAERFEALMREPDFAYAIARLEAQRLRAALGLLADMALHGTRARVARRLLMLARGDLTNASNPRSTIVISQDHIAMMLGMGRTTLNTELRALARSGAIALRYGQIEVKDLELLSAAASA